MRWINGGIYGLIFILFLVWVLSLKKQETELSGYVRYIKKHGSVILLLLLVNSISFGMTFWKEQGQIYIKKDGYGGSEKQVDFLLEKEETKEEVSLTVHPRTLTKKELEAKWQEAFSYLEEHIKGENESLSNVNKNLDFSLDYEEYPFDLEVQPEDYGLMDSEGNLRNESSVLLEAGYDENDLKKGIPTRVTVSLWYGEECDRKVYELLIFPKEESEMEKQFSKASDYLKQQEQDALYQEGFAVSPNVEGVQITRTDQSRVTPFEILVIGGLLIGLLLLRERENVKNEEKRRREQLLRCYPWFVNELVLLLGAGMQVKNIFFVLIEEYENEKKRQKEETNRVIKKSHMEDYKAPLMKELNVARRSLKLGMSEEQVYYQLGRRLKLPCYIKLMTLLEQNVRKGAKGITEAFEQEELAALEERKNLAKRYGEEASTKLLGPMILLLLVVMCMIMIPAFLSFA